MTTALHSPGEQVLATPALCRERPELAGAKGRVEELDGKEVIVAFEGQARRYRVSAHLLEKGTR